MIRMFDNLWGDISAMASVSRGNYIMKVLSDPIASERVALGSDYPIPVSPLIFTRRLGFSKARELMGMKNPLEKNLETFRALGVGPDIMRRGVDLLRL
jgi:hypothetical protein